MFILLLVRFSFSFSLCNFSLSFWCFSLSFRNFKSKCRAAYAQLYNIGKIRKYLDHLSADKLIHALVHSHIDTCNALLFGLPKYFIKKLQMVQNTAARVLCSVGKYGHITPTLYRLHWLPVEFRINYKICLLTFNALNGRGPQYPSEMLTTRSVHYAHISRGSDTQYTTDNAKNSRGSLF